MKFLPVQMPSLADDGVIGEWITKEMDILPSDLACKNVTMFLLSAAKKLQGVCPKLKSTAKVRDPAIFYWRLSRLSEKPTMSNYYITVQNMV